MLQKERNSSMMSLFAVLNKFIKNLMTTKSRECRSGRLSMQRAASFVRAVVHVRALSEYTVCHLSMSFNLLTRTMCSKDKDIRPTDGLCVHVLGLSLGLYGLHLSVAWSGLVSWWCWVAVRQHQSDLSFQQVRRNGGITFLSCSSRLLSPQLLPVHAKYIYIYLSLRKNSLIYWFRWNSRKVITTTDRLRQSDYILAENSTENSNRRRFGFATMSNRCRRLANEFTNSLHRLSQMRSWTLHLQVSHKYSKNFTAIFIHNFCYTGSFNSRYRYLHCTFLLAMATVEGKHV